MRAVQLTRPREAVEVVDLPLPHPRAGEVRVRVEGCALGQLDWNLLTLDAPPRVPLIAGHEAVGVVEGSGQRVLLTPLASSCGACEACAAGEARRCGEVRWRGLHEDGLLTTHVCVQERALAPIDTAFSPELAVCGGSLWTAVGAVRALGLTRSSRVAVFGVGGVGHLAVQVAQAHGHEVWAHDVNPERLEGLRALGAETRVDAAIVCTPSIQALQHAVRVCTNVFLCGSSPAGRVDVSLADLVWRGVTVRSGLLGTRAQLDEAVALLTSGAVTPQVQTLALDEVPARLWELRDLGFPGRLVVRM